MIYLSQRNPAWATKKLGASQLTLGRYGCTTTCISMLSDYFGGYMAPDAIALKRSWFTDGGLILWDKVKIPGMRFVRRVYGDQTGDSLDIALKDPTMAVLLEVNNGQHWVVAIKKNSTSYIVADPWTGATCDVLKVYHNITGGAYFSKT